MKRHQSTTYKARLKDGSIIYTPDLMKLTNYSRPKCIELIKSHNKGLIDDAQLTTPKKPPSRKNTDADAMREVAVDVPKKNKVAKVERPKYVKEPGWWERENL